MSISFIWFDLGYTLLYQQREEPYRAVLAELGHDVHPRSAWSWSTTSRTSGSCASTPGSSAATPRPSPRGSSGCSITGSASVPTCAGRGRCSTRRLRRTGHAGWLPFDGAADALADLRRRGYRLGVITNWDPSARGILAAHGLDRYFEQVVVSCEAGCEKPEPRIFEIATGAARVAPAACLYVGDNYYVDTVGARAAGMASVVVNRFGRQGVEEIADVPIIAHVREIAGWLESAGA